MTRIKTVEISNQNQVTKYELREIPSCKAHTGKASYGCGERCIIFNINTVDV